MGSGAPLKSQTNASPKFQPSLSLHISITENNGSFFLVNKDVVPFSSVRLPMSAACCLFLGSDPAL